MMTGQGWTVGQRVRNEAEPTLGLGIIDGFPTSRSVKVVFPGAAETRIYNPNSAPLRRYELGVGQTAQTQDGRSFRVERIEEDAHGLLTYYGQDHVVPELLLADSSASNDPLQRLLAGEFSDHSAFDLREQGWRLRSEVLRQRCRGLTGARVALLPHQLAIAHKIASREYPRVLLADEVGLGKTIEACLIYSALRALGRADRVLVLTPTSLVHQWLIELYRRFNEFFALGAPEDAEEGADPFGEDSRLIAPLDWIVEPENLEKALEEPWDLIIVDEAHHLGWSREKASPAYAAVEALAARSQGLLLLTATPLRQGLETEFGLLRLVDPDRFADFSRFEAEHARLREVADLARRLDRGDSVASELRAMFPEANWDGTAAESLQQLVDRHGTGRVLVRNRRDKLGGFPGRHLHATVLPLPASWEKATAWPEIGWLRQALGLEPAAGTEPPAKDDPRWDWVLDLVEGLGDHKVVVMASSVAAVKALDQVFRRHTAIKIATFHEQLGLVERDRQAAYFADPEGAQVLLSSEIGGEGRNFQFCHHLALFDLPLHPDALEQRIGRLDRIGQTREIQVHVAVVARTPGEALLAWHRSLRVFDAPLTGGEAMMDALATPLLEVLQHHTPRRLDAAKLETFLANATALMARHQADVQDNVDFLIDLNSFDQPLGEALVAEVQALDRPLLETCVSGLLEHYGVVEEDLADPRIQRIRPGNLMRVDHFPGLRADGIFATYDRELALAREDMQFLSPDHPMVEGALALLLDQHDGRASGALWAEAPAQGVRIDFLFLLEAVGPGRLGLQRFLPPASLALTLDHEGRIQANAGESGARLHALSPQLWTRMVGWAQAEVPALLEGAVELANDELKDKVETAVALARTVLGGEHRRLEELHALGNVSAAELASHAEKVRETLRCLGEARVSLDAVRVVMLDPEGLEHD
ncbi:MAG: SNF2-related protein [Cyanobacteria bacterium RYN_339]|nr:SNF2-related protein [Cyanobacteria bacterium RYN_339]